MNIHSAELLENSLQSAANNLYRNRALAASMQEEAQRNAIEQSFRNAMMQHYANIEERQADNAGLQAQRIENEDNIAAQRQSGMLQQQQQQSGIAQKQNFLRTAMQLNATGQLAPDGLKRVNQWLATDPDLSKTGIQLSTPLNPSTDPAHAQTALSNALSLRSLYQYKYDKEQDPYIRGQYSKVLQDIDASLGGKRSASGTGNSQRSPGRQAANPTDESTQSSGVTSNLTAIPPLQGERAGVRANSSPTNPTIQQSMNPTLGVADPRDVQWLTNNPTPSNLAQFEKVYGAGSSDSFFNPKMPSQQ